MSKNSWDDPEYMDYCDEVPVENDPWWYGLVVFVVGLVIFLLVMCHV